MNRLKLDERSTSESLPFAVYTADGSSPREIDDGVFVEPLDSSSEQYLVGVCVADTSKLYSNGDVRKQAMQNVHAEYWDLPNGDTGYDPMIDPRYIDGLELAQGKLRNSLVVSFTVGRLAAVENVSINFGKIEVKDNMTYKEFSGHARKGGETERFNRASHYILQHLGFMQGGDSSGRNRKADRTDIPLNVSYASWARGARINEAFMVAANHLVGKILKEEGLPAIYRVHNGTDTRFNEFVEANCAVYSREPGPHEGLGVDPYCRVTSPLRRLEDFVMSYHLKLRAQGEQPTKSDLLIMDKVIRDLNRRAIFVAMNANPSVREKSDRIRAINEACQPAKSAAAS